MSEGCAIHWFRKALRLHDNPALIEACVDTNRVYPLFIMDSHLYHPDIVGVNRCAFLLESLHNLHDNLVNNGSRLFVVNGDPVEKLAGLLELWNVTAITFERIPDPYYRELDKKVLSLARSLKVKVSIHSSNTLHEPEKYFTACGGDIPLTYFSFGKLFNELGQPRSPFPSLDHSIIPSVSDEERMSDEWNIPSLSDLGYPELSQPLLFPGGETAALARLNSVVIEKPAWVAKFEKPSTSPNSATPSTTVLSPYLATGCLSPIKFWHEINIITSQRAHTDPPVSLKGQLLWREFFYLAAFYIPHFDSMEKNCKCVQIPFNRDEQVIRSWRMGQTGFPFIDAVMVQLRQTGWIHHAARLAVACFLTRGDLWQHWEEGVNIFNYYLLDADWCLNNANWQWASASCFFNQYTRVDSPAMIGKKTDPHGNYIRKWIPALAKFPHQYIYEPWKAPIETQLHCGGSIGGNLYPYKIVDHDVVSKANIQRMTSAYELNKILRPDENLEVVRISVKRDRKGRSRNEEEEEDEDEEVMEVIGPTVEISSKKQRAENI